MDIDTSYLTTLSGQAVSNANASRLKNTLSGISEAGRGAKDSEASSAEDGKLLDACKGAGRQLSARLRMKSSWMPVSSLRVIL